jgi:hypothetical protein
LLYLGLRPADEDDIGTRFCKSECAGTPKPAPGSADYGDLPIEAHRGRLQS